jgi:hypothetical protein
MSPEGRSLTRREFDAVIRRAAELATSDPDLGEGALSEAELFRIAGEVGLSETHVRRALADIRAGAGGDSFLDRVFGPATLRASRAVRGVPAELASKLDRFFVATQLLQPVRRGVGVLQYRPALDWASQLARAASFTSRQHYLASAKSVEVLLEPVDEGSTLVEIRVDPGTRGDDIAGAVFGGGIGGGGIGALTAWGLASITPLGLAIGVAVGVGVGVSGGVALAMGRAHKGKLSEVRAELEGVLDALEVGASLEPPPAAWRRWVKRQFHGVARDLLRPEDDTDAR